MPYSTSDRRAAHDYSSLGLTAKLRVSHSTLKIGTLMPRLPVVQFNDTRLHPQTFQGGLLEVNEIDGLALQFGQLRQVKQRDSTNAEDLGITRGNKRNVLAGRHPGSDRFDFAGGTYRWSERLSSSYHYANLEDFYRQHHLGVQHLLPLADDQSLKSDIRWARSTDEGGSRVDNRALNALFTYRLGGHAFGLGYQRMSGDSGFAYLAGTDPYLVNFVQIGDFANKDERSWQLRYDYDFAAIGLPGLTFMSRYLRGEHIDLLDGGGRGKEIMDRAVVITAAVITAVRAAIRRRQSRWEWPVPPAAPRMRRRHDSARAAAAPWRRCAVSPAAPISRRARSSAAPAVRRSSSLSRRRGFPPQGGSPSPRSRRPGACRSGSGPVASEA